jgi:hypothetical protein
MHWLGWLARITGWRGSTLSVMATVALRLQSHLALQAMGLTDGLWSPMRGLARRQEEY